MVSNARFVSLSRKPASTSTRPSILYVTPGPPTYSKLASVCAFQQWLGHASLTTTSHYTHLTRSAEQRATETLEHILDDLV